MKYPGWDVDKSIQTIVKNSKPTSQHACAKFVRMALVAGGINTNGNPIAAQDYHFKGFLEKIGFRLIATLPNRTEQDKWTGTNSVPGDIAVMQAPSHNNGHICMWTGKQWISDFRQNHMRPYTSAGRNTETCWIYRWAKS